LSPLKLAPQEYWQPGEREALAAGKPACFFNDLPLHERISRKGEVVLEELGFQDMDYLFHQYTLNGQQGHLGSPWHSAYRTKTGWDKAAIRALHSGDNEALLKAWRDYLEESYHPNECWNLYLLM
ncbi:DUF4132 domain-containing protein, partial [Klebsiella pneumoniae]|nr:DUF4132 domain-containing protein [Klebsiella pneumoniae]